jgi:hypothetical protein
MRRKRPYRSRDDRYGAGRCYENALVRSMTPSIRRGYRAAHASKPQPGLRLTVSFGRLIWTSPNGRGRLRARSWSPHSSQGPWYAARVQAVRRAKGDKASCPFSAATAFDERSHIGTRRRGNRAAGVARIRRWGSGSEVAPLSWTIHALLTFLPKHLPR